MARDPYIERRLGNWARWKRSLTHEGGQGFATCDMAQDRVDGVGFDAEQSIPTFDPEASETNTGLLLLPRELQRTIDEVYLHELPFSRVAERQRVEIATIHARIWTAHRKLSVWLRDRREVLQADRERAEKLQSSVRPPAK